MNKRAEKYFQKQKQRKTFTIVLTYFSILTFLVTQMSMIRPSEGMAKTTDDEEVMAGNESNTEETVFQDTVVGENVPGDTNLNDTDLRNTALNETALNEGNIEDNNVSDQPVGEDNQYSDEVIPSSYPDYNIRSSANEYNLRYSINCDHPVSLKDVLVASGCLEEEYYDDFAANIAGISSEKDTIRASYEEDEWIIETLSDFEEEDRLRLC